MARGHMHRNIKRAAERAERALAAFNDPIPPLPRSERSAAQDVYQIGELRRRILSFCGAGDLIGFMRAEKGCMRDVARVIYYSVKVSKFEGVLSENEERDKMYHGTVSVVRVNNDKEPISDHLVQLDGVIPHVQQHFANARWIVFGDRRQMGGDDTVTVSLDRASHRSGDIKTRTIVNFSLTHTLTAFPDRLEPITFPHSPPKNYSLRHRFDLIIPRDLDPKAPAALAWVRNLGDNASLGYLHNWASLGKLKVTLGDLVSLYGHQDAIGYHRSDRLQTISARYIDSYTIPQFRSFATVAGASLVCAKFASKYRGDKDGLGFDDLQTLIVIVKEHLPNLSELIISLAGVEHAETVSRTALHPEILSESGSIKRLTIYCAPYSGPLFDTIRSLAPVLYRLRAAINISHTQPSAWGEKQQTDYMRHLRVLPPYQRTHLSTVSFTSLDVTFPQSVSKLTFDARGYPYRRGQGKAAKWAESAESIQDRTFTDVVPCIGNIGEAASQLEGISPTASQPEMLQMSLLLLDTLQEARIKAQEMVDAVQKQEGEVQRYINSLVAMAEA